MSHRVPTLTPVPPPLAECLEPRAHLWKARVLSWQRPRSETALLMMLGAAVQWCPEWIHGLSPTWPSAGIELDSAGVTITLEARRPSTLEQHARNLHLSLFLALNQQHLLAARRPADPPQRFVLRAQADQLQLTLQFRLREGWREWWMV